MNKEQLKQLAQNPNHIPGIYNYCDRWCERCGFTARCLNYAMQKKEKNDRKTADLADEQFWQEIYENLNVAKEMLEEMIEQQGIELDEQEMEATMRAEEQRRREAESHELSRTARNYGKMVDSWFKKNRAMFKQREKDLRTEFAIGLGKRELIAEARHIVDATEVIGWYQHQIYVKLMRALCQFDDDIEMEDPIQNDANGSAKVALIGIDRSIEAWSKLHELFPEQSDTILDLLVVLDRLRKGTEQHFPNARAFQRPGFDTIAIDKSSATSH